MEKLAVEFLNWCQDETPYASVTLDGTTYTKFAHHGTVGIQTPDGSRFMCDYNEFFGKLIKESVKSLEKQKGWKKICK